MLLTLSYQSSQLQFFNVPPHSLTHRIALLLQKTQQHTQDCLHSVTSHSNALQLSLNSSNQCHHELQFYCPQHQHVLHAKPPPQFTQNQNSKHTHQIYKHIKNAHNNSSLYQVFRKHRHQLQIDHSIVILEKYVYFLNNLKADRTHSIEVIDNFERDQDIVLSICSQIMKQTRPPQLYIRFISACSSIKSEELFCSYFPFLIKIVKEQFSPQGNGQKKEQEEQADSNAIHSLISIESNIKLIQSVIRILNARIGKIKQEEEALLMVLLKNSINYVHVPASPERLENHVLWDMITQYLKINNLRLGSAVVKALVRDCLKRIKYEDLIKQVKVANIEKPIPQSYIVNSIKKLLQVEKLLLWQTRSQTLKKEVLETKPNNMTYNSFYSIQHKLSKYVCELLPKCQFRAQQTQSETDSLDTNWQHIDLLPLLFGHFKMIFVQMPIDVVSKCELLSATYQQYEACILYLKKLYTYVFRSELLVTGRDRQNLSRMLQYSYKLLHLLMSEEVTCRIPASIIQKCLQVQLMGQLMKNFTYLPSELKIIVIWNRLLSSEDNLLVGQLVTNLASLRSSTSENVNTSTKNTEYLWFIKLVVLHPKYLELVKATDYNEEQFSLNCFKSLLKNISEYESFWEANSEDLIGALGKIIGQKIKYSKYRLEHLDGLLKQHQKTSISNCLFPEYLGDLLHKNKSYLAQKNETRKTQQPRGAQHLREQLVDRINGCLRRTELLLMVANIACSQLEKSSFKAETLRIYTQEIALLNYSNILRKEHLHLISELNKEAQMYCSTPPVENNPE